MSNVTNVRFILSASGVISLWLTMEDGTHPQFSISTDHPNHAKIVGALKTKNYANLEDLCRDASPQAAAQKTLIKEVAKRTAGPLVGTAEIRDGVVFVNNVPVHTTVTERIMQLSKAGFPVEPALRFLELLLQNPSAKAQEELYDFLANRNLPLTEDGHFLGYKRVRHDWRDVYSGTFDNSVGRIVEVPRTEVDPDRANECSNGLHVGALDYVRGYSSGGHVVVVKVSPQDCVSVPRDHNHMKLRTCRYEVLYELHEDSPLPHPVYSSSGAEFASVNDFAESEEVATGEHWIDGWTDEEAGAVDGSDSLRKEELMQLSVDALANRCRDAGLVSTRQHGRDLGREAMVDLLLSNKAAPESPAVEDNKWDDSGCSDDWDDSGCSW